MKPRTLLKEVFALMGKFKCVQDEDSCCGMAFFQARLNEDGFYILKEEIENEISIQPCKFCGNFPEWMNEVYLDKWDGWLTHECKSKFYALAGKKENCYNDWNNQQTNQ